jgi:hypothetical protein
MKGLDDGMGSMEAYLGAQWGEQRPGKTAIRLPVENPLCARAIRIHAPTGGVQLL